MSQTNRSLASTVAPLIRGILEELELREGEALTHNMNRDSAYPSGRIEFGNDIRLAVEARSSTYDWSRSPYLSSVQVRVERKWQAEHRTSVVFRDGHLRDGWEDDLRKKIAAALEQAREAASEAAEEAEKGRSLGAQARSFAEEQGIEDIHTNRDHETRVTLGGGTLIVKSPGHLHLKLDAYFAATQLEGAVKLLRQINDLSRKLQDEKEG